MEKLALLVTKKNQWMNSLGRIKRKLAKTKFAKLVEFLFKFREEKKKMHLYLLQRQLLGKLSRLVKALYFLLIESCTLLITSTKQKKSLQVRTLILSRIATAENSIISRKQKLPKTLTNSFYCLGLFTER